MSEKNKPANAKALSSASGTEPDLSVGSDQEIQDLLRKYLPDYKEPDPAEDALKSLYVQEEAPARKAASRPASRPAASARPASAEKKEEKRAPQKEEKKKTSLFDRLAARRRVRDGMEEDDDGIDAAAPDSGLFDRLAAQAHAGDEDDDDFFASAPSFDEPAATPAAKAEDGETLSTSPLIDEAAFAAAASAADLHDDAPTNAAPAKIVPADDESAESEPEPEEEGEKPSEEHEMDDTDLNLMVAFGLEDQLDRKAGAGTADAVAAQNAEQIRRHDEAQRRAQEYEYTERAQTPRIADAYTYMLRSLKIKLIVGAVLTLVLFFFENITLFGVQHAGVFDPAVFPVVYIMTSLQLMLLVCAVAYEQVLAGLRNLVTGRPTPESVTAVLAIFAILYSSYEAIVSSSGVEPVMYNFAVAFCAMLSMLFAYINTKREIFSFNIVSSKKPKFVLRRASGDESAQESAAFGDPASGDEDVLQITRAGFVDGYFGRTAAILHSTRVYVGAMLTVVTAASILLAVIAALRGAGASGAVTVAYISVLAAIPMSMFFTYSYPFYMANREAYAYDSTIVGESSIEEYAGSSIISFDDTNVFPSYSVKVQNIKVYNNHRIDRVLYYAASAFTAAGGPLSDVFDVATIEMGHSDDVEIVGAGSGYLDTRVDGRRVVFGRSAVLTEMGLEIPEEIVEEDSYIEGDFSIMYMACDGDLIAKMYIKYIMDADFEFIVRQFTQNGTCVCVKTLDPNVDEEMIFSKVKGKKYPLRVIKDRDGEREVERAESGIVTRGTTKSLLQVVSFCDMVMNLKRSNMIISIVAAALTLFIMCVVSLSGSVGRIGSWLIVLYQLFWFLPSFLTAKFNIK